MTRNTLLFKILFTIELALLPMAIASYLFLAPWATSVFIAGLLLTKIWLHIFNDKTKLSEIIISIGNILMFTALLILFVANGLINVVLGVFVIILVALQNIFRVALYNKVLNDTIEAVDYCYTIFECLALVAFTFLIFFALISNIALFAIVLTSTVAVVYKIYYTLKYTNFITTLNKSSVFRPLL